MPWQVAAGREVVQRVTDLAGVSIESGQRRHLAVRGHAAAGDTFDDGVDAGPGGGSRSSGVGA